MSEYKNKTVEIINNKPMFKEDKNYLFWHPMHTFLKVPTSSSVKCAIAQLYPANWLFSHPALCLPVLMNVDVVADSASGLGRPLQPCTARWSVCGVYYCRTGSVLYTFSSNTTRVSSSVHGDMGTVEQSIYNNLHVWDSSRDMSNRMGPSIWFFVTFQQFVLEQNSTEKKHMNKDIQCFKFLSNT